MPSSFSPATLRVEPQAIPALRIAYADAVTRVGQQIRRLRHEAVIREPWLGDETSQAVHNTYNQIVMDAPEGPYAAMVAYHAELVRVCEQLQLMEDAYRSMEDGVAASWGRA